MAFHNVRFPDDVSYGSKGGVGFRTDVIEMDSGFEQRVSRWSRGKHQFNAAYGIKNMSQLSSVKSFYMARKGAAYAFRYKDWSDFNSTADGVNTTLGGTEISNDDQVCQRLTSTTYQLVKVYGDDVYSTTRTITKPVSGSVIVAVDGIVSSPSVNHTTGVITFGSAISEGAVVTAGFEFDVPVRFTDDADQLLNISVDSFDIGSIPDVNMIEVLEPTELTEYGFTGGSRSVNVTEDLAIVESEGRVQLFINTDADHDVSLPIVDTLNYQAGGPYFYLCNSTDSTHDIIVKSSTEELISLSPGAACTVVLHIDYELSTYQWIVLA